MKATSLIALVRNDLRLFFTDRRAMVITFALPIVLAAFMGWLFGGSGGGGQASAITVQVVAPKADPLTTRIIASLQADSSLKVERTSEAQAKKAVRGGKVPVALVFPAGFGDEAPRAFFGAAQKPRLTVLYDPSHGTEKAMVEGILTQHVMKEVSAAVFSGEGQKKRISDALAHLDEVGIPPADRPAFRDMLQSISHWYALPKANGTNAAARGLSLPYTVRDEAVTAGHSKYNGYAHAFAGMAIMFVFFGAIDMAIEILRDRERGLWRRFRASPLSRGALPLAKVLSSTILLLLLIVVSFLVAELVFGVRIHVWIGFLLISAASALCAAAFGLLIAALGKTPEATRGIAIFAVLVLAMLGGAWMPTFIFPAWLQKATVLIPTRWAVDGLEAVTWRGLGLHAALAPTAALLAFALVFGAVAVARFRWDAD